MSTEGVPLQPHALILPVIPPNMFVTLSKLVLDTKYNLVCLFAFLNYNFGNESMKHIFQNQIDLAGTVNHPAETLQ